MVKNTMSNTENTQTQALIKGITTTLEDLIPILKTETQITNLAMDMKDMAQYSHPYEYLRSIGYHREVVSYVWRLTRLYKQANNIRHMNVVFDGVGDLILSQRGFIELKLSFTSKTMPIALIKTLRDRAYKKDLIKFYRRLGKLDKIEHQNVSLDRVIFMAGENTRLIAMLYEFFSLLAIYKYTYYLFGIENFLSAIRYLL